MPRVAALIKTSISRSSFGFVLRGAPFFVISSSSELSLMSVSVSMDLSAGSGVGRVVVWAVEGAGWLEFERVDVQGHLLCALGASTAPFHLFVFSVACFFHLAFFFHSSSTCSLSMRNTMVASGPLFRAPCPKHCQSIVKFFSTCHWTTT